MRAAFRRVGTLMIGMLVTYGVVGHSQGAAGSWLNEPTLPSWNAAGQEIPAAPRVPDLVNPRCRDRARPAERDEDRQVQARGWDLVGPLQGGGDLVIVRGTASYDGMCRPMQYQDFVFVRGTFAGTLAPKPMDSRTDGSLTRVTLQSPTELIAQYSRYEEADPLCCPSRITRVEFEIEGDPSVVRARSASTER